MNTGTNFCMTGEYDDSFFFHSVCECTDNNHSQDIMLEMDKDGYFIECRIFQDLFWADWKFRDAPFYERWWIRICHSTRYLLTGQVRMQGTHLFEKEQHIRDYAEALLGAIDELNKRRRNMSAVRTAIGEGKRGPAPFDSKSLQGKGTGADSSHLPS